MTSPPAVSVEDLAASGTSTAAHVAADAAIDQSAPTINQLTAVPQSETFDAQKNVCVELLPYSSMIPSAQINGAILSDERSKSEKAPEYNQDMANIPAHQSLQDFDTTDQLMKSTKTLGLLAAFSDSLGEMDMLAHGVSNNMLFFNEQGTLPANISLPMTLNHPLGHLPYLGAPAYIPEPEETRVSAYAKLIFADGHFYMNTYAVILGRDLVAVEAARKEEELKTKRLLEEETNVRNPRTPVRVKHEESHYSKSIVSESGGILRTGNDSDQEDRQYRRRFRKRSRISMKSKSTGSSSAVASRRNSRRSSVVQTNKVDTYKPHYQSKVSPQTAGAAPVDPASLRPSPHDVPIVPIHPPANSPLSAYTAISRKHVKIAYSNKKRTFEATILGRNGCFIQDRWYHANDVVPLASGHTLQVGGILVQFILPNQLDSNTIAEHEDGLEEDDRAMNRYSEGGKEMSLDFLDEGREGALEDTSEECSNAQGSLDDGDESDSDEVNEADEDEDVDDEDRHDDPEVDDEANMESGYVSSPVVPREKVECEVEIEGHQVHKPKLKISLTVDKKRGPGRPPKNGILSKREQKLLAKAELIGREIESKKETEKGTGKVKGSTSGKDDLLLPHPVTKPAGNCDEKTAEGPSQQPALPTKNKVGRPRKHPLPEVSSGPPREKRKYTRRKPKEPKEPKEAEAIGSGSGEDGKVKKEKNPPRPPRSPSPEMREEDYTPEQLSKPQANYVTLIHEAIATSKEKKLALPDIYKSIYTRYPFFKFKVPTLGWQSSVRHNLSQHHAFCKLEKDGKGWKWGIVNGISIEKEKKKRLTPPPQIHQPMYQSGQPIMGQYPRGPPPPGLQIPHQMQPGSYCQYKSQIPPYTNGRNAQGLPNFIASIPPQLAAPNMPASYSSPYASKPAGTDTSSQSTEQNSLADRQSTGLAAPLVVGSDSEQQQADQLQMSQTLPQGQPNEAQTGLIGATQNSPSQSQVGAKAPQILSQDQSLAPPPAQAQSSTQPQSQPQGGQSFQTTMQWGPAPENEEVMQAAETFRKKLIATLKNKQSEIIVNSAINRVLRLQTKSDIPGPGNPHEDMIMAAARAMLSKIAGSTIEAQAPQDSSVQMINQSSDQQNSPHQTESHLVQLPMKMSGPDRAIQTPTRPTFTTAESGRLSASVLCRSEMTATGVKLINPEISAYATLRISASPASPAPEPSPVPIKTDGVSTAMILTKEKGQIAGQKRPHDIDLEDIQELKRVATSGPT